MAIAAKAKQLSKRNGHGNDDGIAGKTSVMLVDDDPAFLRVTKTLLEMRYGDRVDVVGTATSGEESLTLARLLAPQVVLMDLQMPGMGGLGTIPLLRILFPETRIIALTHEDGLRTRRLVKEAGGFDLISKGDIETHLIRAIERRNDSTFAGVPEIAT